MYETGFFAFERHVDYEGFRPALEKALEYGDRPKGGRPPCDPVTMPRSCSREPCAT